MKTVLVSAIIVAGGMFLTGEAVAQTSQAAAANAVPWEGFYLGAHAAYHHGEEIEDGGCVGLCARDHEVKEVYLAVQAGYDFPVADDVIVGAMAWFGVTPVKSKARLSPTVVVEGKTTSAGFLGLRAGLERGPWLPYAFVGYERITTRVTNEAAPIKKNKGTHDGVGLGAGAEYRVARNWSVDGRYMYSDLGKDGYDFGGGKTRHGEQAHTFSLGVNYRF